MHSQAAEAAVIASGILDATCIPQILTMLSEDDFFDARNREIFSGLKTVWTDAPNLDGLMLRQWLTDHGHLETAGGLDYLKRLIESVPIAENWKYYALIVREKSQYRAMVTAVTAMQSALAENDDVSEQADTIRQLALGIGDRTADELYEVSENATRVALAAQDGREALPTGFYGLDHRLGGGVAPGELLIVAGRPSMGKSALGVQIAANVAEKGKHAAIVSLEVRPDEVTQRLIAQRSKVNPLAFRHDPAQDILDRWHQASLDLQSANILIDANADSPGRIQQLVRTRKQTPGLDLLVIDYLGLMKGDSPCRSRYEEMTAISRLLKRIAMTENIPVIALAQLNREPEARTDHRPRMSDLRDSGSIEQDADVIMLLYRADYYRRRDDPQAQVDGMAEIIVTKVRNGTPGVERLTWLAECTRFDSLACCDLRG